VTSIPLRTGPLSAAGFTIQRSGIRWLCDDGHICRPGEIIAFCNVAVVDQRLETPFSEELRDFQVAFATRVGGQLRKAVHSSRGGFLDQQAWSDSWTSDSIIGHLDCSPGNQGSGSASDGELRLLLYAGRRVTELAEIRSGLFTGWHERSRAWWEGDGTLGTVLSLGICELSGIIRGERSAFLEMFASAPGPAQIVFIPDLAMVPCAAVTYEQLKRTTDQFQDIMTDFARSFSSGSVLPTADDWIFGGCLLSALQKSPLTEHYQVLTRTGLRRTGPADVVILSLNAEPAIILRHRRLGYRLRLHDFRVAQAGPVLRAWLKTEFEPIKRAPEDILHDYRALVEAVHASTDMKFLILNAMSSSGLERIYNYAPFDIPMHDTLMYIRNKELNLMLQDLERECDVSIVDQDAIAAEIGAAEHLPDGVHSSGLMQAEVRAEILRILRARGIPGFGPPRSSDLELDKPRY
jgi:hypothetical protein